MRTWRIEQWLRRDYSLGSYELASQLLDRLTIELAAWSIVTETDRLEAAALKYAAADLRELPAAVELALLDWRDLLVSVGDD